jgi:hypothetical protein
VSKEAEKDFKQRLADARQFKSDIRADLMEGYFFTAPRRARDVTADSASRGKSTASADQAELQTTLGIECSDDFTGMAVDAFMPSHLDWCRRGQGHLPNAVWAEIAQDVGVQDAVIMATIRASKLHAVIDQAFNPDLSLGTAALWIEQGASAAPPEVRPVPIKNLDINIGPNGVDERFVSKFIAARNLKGELGDLPFSDKTRQKIEKQPSASVEVNWGLWRDYSVPLEERWQYKIMADKHLVHEEVIVGDGSCPLLVMRFGVDPTNPWGDGPTLQALPYLRVADALAGVTQDNAEFQVDPAFIYPNDGFINFEGGIQHGMAYPGGPGFDAKNIAWLRPDSNPNAGYLTIEDLRQAVRRLYYSDFPEQKGKTPPTASQWVDEMVKMQKRIGLKGQMFWWEGPRAIFQRFRYLLEKAGIIRPIVVNGATVALEPYNPAVKGQEYQEVQTAIQLLQTGLAFGGIQFQAALNTMATLDNLQRKLGDSLVVWNTEEEAQKMMMLLAPQADLNIGNAPNVAQ